MVNGIPERGDVVWLTFEPHAGREQAGTRPALVLSPVKYNVATGLAVVCPMTSRAKGYPFEVPFKGRRIAGVVLADHVKSIDWRVRNASFAERADGLAERVALVISALINARES